MDSRGIKKTRRNQYRSETIRLEMLSDEASRYPIKRVNEKLCQWRNNHSNEVEKVQGSRGSKGPETFKNVMPFVRFLASLRLNNDLWINSRRAHGYIRRPLWGSCVTCTCRPTCLNTKNDQHLTHARQNTM